MKKATKFWFVSFLLLLCLSSPAIAASDLEKPVPFDPAVVQGKLENGLTYFIRSNKKPEARGELRLVIRAGSVLEDDDQTGLAHFVEHMAFNGTRNFEKQELINYLESIGMNFGPDINAYTSFDETVYMLKIPTDDAAVIQKAFQILEDWAHNVSFDPEEIDKERPVIVEEWRLGRGAAARMRDQQWPVLFKGSKYAERLPIGKKEVIENFKHETLLRFYKDWYRPDLMAVIAVGDFDISSIEKSIRSHFSGLKNPENSRPRETFAVPPHEETRYAIVSDPENARSGIQVIYKSVVEKSVTGADARQELTEALMFQMLNRRLMERTVEAKPPYLMAFSGKQRFIGEVEALVLGAIVGEDGIDRGFSAALEEARRAQIHGFTDGELQREKADILRAMDKRYENRDKSESYQLADTLVESFLYGEPDPGIAWEYQFIKDYLPGIKLEEVNQLAQKGFEGKNAVVLVNLPQKEGVKIPTQEELASVLAKARELQTKAYTEQVYDGPLLKNPPPAGSIVSEKQIPELGLTQWDLSNGIQVLLKPTDFKNDEILISAWSPGGSSLVPDENAVSADYADQIVTAGGVGELNEIQLDKALSGKIASASPYISTYYEGFTGRSAPKDLETALQLLYLRFTAPRLDPDAIAAYLARQKSVLENRSLQPEARFRDEFSKIISQNHPRARTPSVDMLKEIRQDQSFQIYRNRFADAGDFAFVFVGSFQVDAIKPLVLTYLGGLPSLKRNESWKDLKIVPPEGRVEKTFSFGKEPKSTVLQVFHGTFEWSLQNRMLLRVLCDYLTIRLREILREDMGGVYGVGVYSADTRIPQQRYQVFIRFGCAPERVNELRSAVFAEIENLKTNGADLDDLGKVYESLRRRHQEELKENGYWLSAVEAAYKDELDVREILKFEDRVKLATAEAIQQTARAYMNSGRYIEAVMVPEKQ